MLNDFKTGNGAMASIPNLRGLYGGEVAVLLVAPGFLPDNANGQAFKINALADEAFCVVNYDQAAAAGAWTFAHEIGHLQGCRHQRAHTNGGNRRYGRLFVCGSNARTKFLSIED